MPSMLNKSLFLESYLGLISRAKKKRREIHFKSYKHNKTHKENHLFPTPYSHIFLITT